jgi:hypothetical protein
MAEGFGGKCGLWGLMGALLWLWQSLTFQKETVWLVMGLALAMDACMRGESVSYFRLPAYIRTVLW